MRNWLDGLADWLDSPMGGLVAFGLTMVIRGLWPRLSAAARKAASPTRKKGAKHQHQKHAHPAAESAAPRPTI